MSLLKIIHYGHPLLREKAHDLKGVGRRERELIAAMAETMYAARGIGLAAPQVGVLERLFVVDSDQDRDEEDEGAESVRNLRVFINPVITWESEEDEPFKEGCLSIPGVEGEVFRPSRIMVSARDENFEPFEVEADELLARVIQHEQDHLEGVLFVDRLALLKRTMLAGQLNKIKSGVLEELPELGSQYPIAVAAGDEPEA
jgi:peptide deformylase